MKKSESKKSHVGRLHSNKRLSGETFWVQVGFQFPSRIQQQYEAMLETLMNSYLENNFEDGILWAIETALEYWRTMENEAKLYQFANR